ncbi:MAG: dihydropteroate synthase [Brevundimonas sp.]
MSPRVMGIVNVTPDSFSDGGRLASAQAAIEHAMRLVADGADILDIGGESTRPGAAPVAVDEEIARTLPVIVGLRARWDGPISIDTMKPEVARAAVAAGASIWNDVAGLGFTDDAAEVAAELGCDVIIMHGLRPRSARHVEVETQDIVSAVIDDLHSRADRAIAAGVPSSRITLDPGIGFGKTPEQGLRLTAGLNRIKAVGFPVLYGASRKRLIAAVDPSAADAGDRLGGSLALALAAADRGADVIRVHDVRETAQALKLRAALEA